MKNLAKACIIGGVAVFAIAVIARLANLQPLVDNPATGLWRVSVTILLTAIAIGVNR
ncbi:MAG: hypothetical protein NTW09_02720 [Candidatus Omnitrophica bacterium]|nr:hypothetical protein [Candidatus Omnitrophota bacterium]